MYYVYLIVDETDREVYVGFTADLHRRMAEHRRGTGAKYTRKGIWRLAYYEAFLSQTDAPARERRPKHDGRARYQLYGRIERSLAGQK